MKLKVGKKYKNKEGKIVTIVSIFPYMDNNGDTYTQSGSFNTFASDHYDLVEEVKTNDKKISFPTNMKKVTKITYNNVSENDMRNFLHEAIDRLGVSGGQQIPKDMLELREELIKVMFGENE